MQAPAFITPSSNHTLMNYALEMRRVLKQLEQDNFAAGQGWPQRWMTPGSPAAADLHAANTLCVASFVAYVKAAVAVMQTAEAEIGAQHDPGSANEGQLQRSFYFVWSSMHGVCYWFSNWAAFKNWPVMVDLMVAQPVLNTFMAWLLKFIQTGGAVQQTLLACLKEHRIGKRSMSGFIRPSILLLRIASEGSTGEITGFPRGFIATLCCLVCDLASRPLGHRCLVDSLHDQAGSQYDDLIRRVDCHLCKYFEKTVSSGPLNPELFSPAAVEVVKRVVTICHTTPDIPLAQIISIHHHLFNRLRTKLKHEEQPLLEQQQQHTNSSPAISIMDSRRLDTLAATHPCFLTPDPNLLSFFLRSSVRFPESMDVCTQLMCVMLLNWQDNGGLSVFPKAIASLPGVLLHCSRHLCGPMLQQRKQQQQQQRRTQYKKHVTGLLSPNISARSRDQLKPLMLLAQGLYINESRNAEGGWAHAHVMISPCFGTHNVGMPQPPSTSAQPTASAWPNS